MMMLYITEMLNPTILANFKHIYFLIYTLISNNMLGLTEFQTSKIMSHFLVRKTMATENNFTVFYTCKKN